MVLYISCYNDNQRPYRCGCNCNIVLLIIIISRQFLTRRNTTEVITRACINAEADDLSHSVLTHISYELSVVRLQRDLKTVNRLLGTNVLRQSVPLRWGSDGEWASAELRGSPRDDEVSSELVMSPVNALGFSVQIECTKPTTAIWW